MLTHKAFVVVLLGTVKLLITPITAIGFGFTYFESVLLTIIGSFIGVTVFFWLSEIIAERFAKKKGRKKKIFNRINRMIIRVKHSLGIKGLSFFGPPFLSIPLTCAIMAKFYKHQAKTAYSYLCASVVFWAFLLSAVSFLF